MNKTDRLKALFGVVTLLAVTAVASGQTRRQQATSTVVLTSVSNDQLAAAYHSGPLPKPLRKPEGTHDVVAAALAKRVAAGDEQSLPASSTSTV